MFSHLGSIFKGIVPSGMFGMGKIDKPENLAELKAFRRNAHIRKTREKINSELNAIAAGGDVTSPLYPNRPYGLPLDMEGHRRHVWDLIFVQVNDCERIINLREVCVMFNELLQLKFIASMLPQVLGNTFANVTTDWESEKEDWWGIMLELRTLSRASKESVDSIIYGDWLDKDGTEWPEEPYFLLRIRNETLILKLNTSKTGKGRLEKMLRNLENENNSEHSFPFNVVIMDEFYHFINVPMQTLSGETVLMQYIPTGFDIQQHRRVDVPYLRDSFETALEKVGSKITSFLYGTSTQPLQAYANLVKWLALMPNLQDLIVKLHEPSPYYGNWEATNESTGNPSRAFPSCPRLKRYAEGPKGLGVTFLMEIFRANPTIEEVLLFDKNASYYDGADWGIIAEALDNLQLRKFHCPYTPGIQFFQHNFSWTLQLTELTIMDTRNPGFQGENAALAETFFSFIANFVNVEKLELSTPFIREARGCLELPKLKHVLWAVFSLLDSMKFLEPVEVLQSLDLDVRLYTEEEDVMKFLGEWNIPSLFPELTRIRMRIYGAPNFWTIWSSGSA